MQENVDLRQSGFSSDRSNGQAPRRLVPRRFDLRYLVSALTTLVADEHLLLWYTLVALLKHHEFPPEVLSEELRSNNVSVELKSACA